MNDELQWIYGLKGDVTGFMQHQKSKTLDGYYKYSFSGDLYDESVKWNVGSSTFALKIYYVLGLEKNEDIVNCASYIKSFLKNSKSFYDPLVYKKSFLRNLVSSVRSKDFLNINNQKYINAETRQAFSSLLLFDELPSDIQVSLPNSKQGIDGYLSNLNWHEPWAAGSHFSHLMFFLSLARKIKQISDEEYLVLKEFSLQWINNIRQEKDGGWYLGTQSDRYVINGAMKIITGLINIQSEKFLYAKELVDTCLRSVNDEHACDNFNIIFVLNYASKVLNRSYRNEEIRLFAIDRLAKYKEHYVSEQGGFKFFPHKSNDVYYGAKISKGLNEADIHGTVLFMWGISIVVQILEIEDELGFQEFFT